MPNVPYIITELVNARQWNAAMRRPRKSVDDPVNTLPKSDSSFSAVKDTFGFLAIGLTHEVVGPALDDGGPVLLCVCPNAEAAKRIRAALELVDLLQTA
jgi:hypothetical protein